MLTRGVLVCTTLVPPWDQLGLVWARLGLTEVLDQLECSDFAPIHTIKVEREHELWLLPTLLIWRGFQQLPIIWQDSGAGYSPIYLLF